MQRVLVIDKSKNPLMPCHPARARGLLAQRKAVVYNFKPFTIMLIDRVGGEKQVVELKFDPGSKVTGIAAVIVGKHGGNFNIATQNGIIQGINWRYCQLIQRTDGYMYT